MNVADVEPFESFVDAVDARAATLVVLNRTEPGPILSLLERVFERQPVHAVEHEVPGPIEDLVVLLDGTDGVATSPLEAVARSFLLINADRFRTGANDLEAETVPAVLRELTDVEFEVRGYPESAEEKLRRIVVSRFVEVRALRTNAGELRVGFQRLSREDDEFGTRAVYERLGESAVETHVYGVANGGTEIPDGVDAHADGTAEDRRSWFLVFESHDAGADAVALVAWETGDNRWRGTWTFDGQFATAVGEYVRASL